MLVARKDHHAFGRIHVLHERVDGLLRVRRCLGLPSSLAAGHKLVSLVDEKHPASSLLHAMIDFGWRLALEASQQVERRGDNRHLIMRTDPHFDENLSNHLGPHSLPCTGRPREDHMVAVFVHPLIGLPSDIRALSVGDNLLREFPQHLLDVLMANNLVELAFHKLLDGLAFAAFTVPSSGEVSNVTERDHGFAHVVTLQVQHALWVFPHLFQADAC
mmetsp:Transcript_19545/g.32244  ORF Transcript_19545/g.32244 Transcript_19545/m.32244 type:complete len:217 (-) Transcript_19545:1260-1910(-)